MNVFSEYKLSKVTERMNIGSNNTFSKRFLFFYGQLLFTSHSNVISLKVQNIIMWAVSERYYFGIIKKIMSYKYIRVTEMVHYLLYFIYL